MVLCLYPQSHHPSYPEMTGSPPPALHLSLDPCFKPLILLSNVCNVVAVTVSDKYVYLSRFDNTGMLLWRGVLEVTLLTSLCLFPPSQLLSVRRLLKTSERPSHHLQFIPPSTLRWSMWTMCFWGRTVQRHQGTPARPRLFTSPVQEPGSWSQLSTLHTALWPWMPQSTQTCSSGGAGSCQSS